jgi:hypothetical protein
VRGHLTGDPTYQEHLVRFVENHDEPRAATAFDTGQAPVAAVTALTQTGARLIHHGQLTGRRTRLPVFLGRYPDEPTDTTVARFYRTLLDALRSHLPRRPVAARREHRVARLGSREPRRMVLGRRHPVAHRGQPR